MKVFSFTKTTLFLNIIFVVSAALIFFISGITYKSMTNIQNSGDKLYHSYYVSLELEKLNILVKDLETLKRDYLLTEDENLKIKIQAKKMQIITELKKIRQLTNDNPIQQKHLDSLHILINQKFKIVDEVVLFTSTFQDPEVLKRNLMSGKHIMNNLNNTINEMIVLEKKLLEERKFNNSKDIKTTPLLFYISLLFTLLLIIISYIKMNADLKKMKIINSELSVSNEINRFGEIIGNYGNWQWNSQQNTYYFSDNLYRLLGENPGAFKPTAENFISYVHPDDQEFVTQQTAKMEQTVHLPQFKYRILKKNGEILYIRASGKSYTNKSNEKIIIGTALDITEEELLNEEMENKNRILAQKNKDLEAFNYIASHDLQEPLRKIQTFISRINDKELVNLSENGKDYLNRVSSAAERMRILIQDLLQFSRTSTVDKVFEEIDLNSILQQTLSELSATIEDKKAVIQAQTLPTLKVIPFQISQLFDNLISNALKYTTQQPLIRITVNHIKGEQINIPYIQKNKIYYQISFHDNGIGFNEEYKTKIFQLFYRLHDNQFYQGSGIGLAICKKIVENHNGFILAESQPEKGSVFHVLLPENN